ncbi:hypothetical protein CUMW_043080 [Citrus unshiu]|nr:hypothetical protein CUMW_043080 [Citrus unshiu]
MVTNDYITVNDSGSGGFGKIEEDYIKRHHKHDVHDHQCSSSLVKHIKAPVHLVSIYALLLLFFKGIKILIVYYLFDDCFPAGVTAMGLFIAVLKLSQVLSGRAKYMLDKSFLVMALDFDFD